MNQTSNYQLNQWEDSDLILREDFNADNEKVDSALAELSGRSILIPIKEFHVSIPAVTVTLPLTGIDWDRWQAVVFDFDMVSDKTNLVAQVSPTGSIDQLIGTFRINNTATPAAERDGPSRMIVFSNCCGRTPVHTIMLRRDAASFFSIPDHLNSMTELYIKNGSDSNFTTESTVRIYGIQ